MEITIREIKAYDPCKAGYTTFLLEGEKYPEVAEAIDKQIPFPFKYITRTNPHEDVEWLLERLCKDAILSFPHEKKNRNNTIKSLAKISKRLATAGVLYLHTLNSDERRKCLDIITFLDFEKLLIDPAYRYNLLPFLQHLTRKENFDMPVSFTTFLKWITIIIKGRIEEEILRDCYTFAVWKTKIPQLVIDNIFDEL